MPAISPSAGQPAGLQTDSGASGSSHLAVLSEAELIDFLGQRRNEF